MRKLDTGAPFDNFLQISHLCIEFEDKKVEEEVEVYNNPEGLAVKNEKADGTAVQNVSAAPLASQTGPENQLPKEVAAVKNAGFQPVVLIKRLEDIYSHVELHRALLGRSVKGVNEVKKHSAPKSPTEKKYRRILSNDQLADRIKTQKRKLPGNDNKFSKKQCVLPEVNTKKATVKPSTHGHVRSLFDDFGLIKEQKLVLSNSNEKEKAPTKTQAISSLAISESAVPALHGVVDIVKKRDKKQSDKTKSSHTKANTKDKTSTKDGGKVSHIQNIENEACVVLNDVCDIYKHNLLQAIHKQDLIKSADNPSLMTNAIVKAEQKIKSLAEKSTSYIRLPLNNSKGLPINAGATNSVHKINVEAKEEKRVNKHSYDKGKPKDGISGNNSSLEKNTTSKENSLINNEKSLSVKVQSSPASNESKPPTEKSSPSVKILASSEKKFIAETLLTKDPKDKHSSRAEKNIHKDKLLATRTKPVCKDSPSGTNEGPEHYRDKVLAFSGVRQLSSENGELRPSQTSSCALPTKLAQISGKDSSVHDPSFADGKARQLSGETGKLNQNGTEVSDVTINPLRNGKTSERRPSLNSGENNGEKRPSEKKTSSCGDKGNGNRRPSDSHGERRPSVSGGLKTSTSQDKRRPSTSGDERKPSSGSEKRPSSSGSERRPSLSGGERRPSISSAERRPSTSRSDRRPSAATESRPSISSAERRASISEKRPSASSENGSTEKRSSTSSTKKRHSSSSTERRLSATGDERKPSATGDERRPSVTEDKRRPSVTEDKRRPSVTEDKRRPSVTGDEKRTSATGDERRTSATGDERRTSASGDERRTSATGDERRTSVTGDERKPSGTVDERRPSGTVDERRLSATKKERRPSGTVHERRPSGTVDEGRPSGTVAEKRPSGTGNEKKPSTTGDEKKPSTTGDEKKPSTTGDEKKPSTTGNKKRPSATGNEKRPLATGNKKGLSATGNEKKPAISGGERRPSSSSVDKNSLVNRGERKSSIQKQPDAKSCEKKPLTDREKFHTTSSQNSPVVREAELKINESNQMSCSSDKSVQKSKAETNNSIIGKGEVRLTSSALCHESEEEKLIPVGNTAIVNAKNEATKCAKEDGCKTEQIHNTNIKHKSYSNLGSSKQNLPHRIDRKAHSSFTLQCHDDRIQPITKSPHNLDKKRMLLKLRHPSDDKTESLLNSPLSETIHAAASSYQAEYRTKPLNLPSHRDDQTSPKKSPRTEEAVQASLNSPRHCEDKPQSRHLCEKINLHGVDKIQPLKLSHAEDKIQRLKLSHHHSETIQSGLKSSVGKTLGASKLLSPSLKSTCHSDEKVLSVHNKSLCHADEKLQSLENLPCDVSNVKPAGNLTGKVKSSSHSKESSKSPVKHVKTTLLSETKSKAKSSDKPDNKANLPHHAEEYLLQHISTGTVYSKDHDAVKPSMSSDVLSSSESCALTSNDCKNETCVQIQTPNADGKVLVKDKVLNPTSQAKLQVSLGRSLADLNLSKRCLNATEKPEGAMEVDVEEGVATSIPNSKKGMTHTENCANFTLLSESSVSASCKGIVKLSEFDSKDSSVENITKPLPDKENHAEVSCPTGESTTAPVCVLPTGNEVSGHLKLNTGTSLDDTSCTVNNIVAKIQQKTANDVDSENLVLPVAVGSSAFETEHTADNQPTALMRFDNSDVTPETITPQSGSTGLPSDSVVCERSPTKTSYPEGMSCSNTSERIEVSYTTRDSLLSAGATSDDDQVGLMERVTYPDVEGVSSDSLGMGATNVYGVPEGTILDTEDNDLGLMIADVRGQAADMFESYDSHDTSDGISLVGSAPELSDLPTESTELHIANSITASSSVNEPSLQPLSTLAVTQLASLRGDNPSSGIKSECPSPGPSPSKYNNKILEPLYSLLDEVEKETDDITVDDDCIVVVAGNKLESKESLSKRKIEQQFLPDSSDDDSVDGELVIDTLRSDSHDVELSQNSMNSGTDSMPSITQLCASFKNDESNSVSVSVKEPKPPPEWKLQKITNLQERFPILIRRPSDSWTDSRRSFSTKGTTTEGVLFSGKVVTDHSFTVGPSKNLIDPRSNRIVQFSGEPQKSLLLNDRLTFKRLSEGGNDDTMAKRAREENPKCDRILDMPSFTRECNPSIMQHHEGPTEHPKSRGSVSFKARTEVCKVGNAKQSSAEDAAENSCNKSVTSLTTPQELTVGDPTSSEFALAQDRQAAFLTMSVSKSTLATKGTSTSNVLLSEKSSIQGHPVSDRARSQAEKIKRLKDQLKEWKQRDEAQQASPAVQSSAPAQTEDLVQTALDAAFHEADGSEGKKVDDEQAQQKAKTSKKMQRAKTDAAQKLKTMMAVQDIVDQARESRLAQELPGYNWLEAKIKSGDMTAKPQTPRKVTPTERKVTPPASSVPSASLSSPKHGVSPGQELQGSSGANTQQLRRVLPKPTLMSPAPVRAEDRQNPTTSGPVVAVSYPNIVAVSGRQMSVSSIPTSSVISATNVVDATSVPPTPSVTTEMQQSKSLVVSAEPQCVQGAAIPPATVSRSSIQATVNYTPIAIPISPPLTHTSTTQPLPTPTMFSQAMQIMNQQPIFLNTIASVQVNQTATVTTVASTKPITQTSRLNNDCPPKPSPTIGEQEARHVNNLISARIRGSQPIFSEPNAAPVSTSNTPTTLGNLTQPSTSTTNSAPVTSSALPQKSAAGISKTNNNPLLVSVNGDERLIPVSSMHSPILVNVEPCNSSVAHSVNGTERTRVKNQSSNNYQQIPRTLGTDHVTEVGRPIWNPIQVPSEIQVSQGTFDVATSANRLTDTLTAVTQTSSSVSNNSLVRNNSVPSVVIPNPQYSAAQTFMTTVESNANRLPTHQHQTSDVSSVTLPTVAQAPNTDSISKKEATTVLSCKDDVICIDIPLADGATGQPHSRVGVGMRRSLTPQEIQRLNDQTASQPPLLNVSNIARSNVTAVTQSQHSVQRQVSQGWLPSTNTANQSSPNTQISLHVTSNSLQHPSMVKSYEENHLRKSTEISIGLRPSQNDRNQLHEASSVQQFLPRQCSVRDQPTGARESVKNQSSPAFTNASPSYAALQNILTESATASAKSEQLPPPSMEMRPLVVQPTPCSSNMVGSRSQSLTDLDNKNPQQLDKEMESRKTELMELERLARAIDEDRLKVLDMMREKKGQLKEMEQTMQHPSVSVSSVQPARPVLPDPPAYPGQSSVHVESRKRPGESVAHSIPEKRPTPVANQSAQAVYIVPTQNGFVRSEGPPPPQYQVPTQQTVVPNRPALPNSSSMVGLNGQNNIDNDALHEAHVSAQKIKEAARLQAQKPWLQQSPFLQQQAKLQAEAQMEAEARMRAQMESQTQAVARAQANALTQASHATLAQASRPLSQTELHTQAQREINKAEIRPTPSSLAGGSHEMYRTVGHTGSERIQPATSMSSCSTCMAVTGSNRCWMHSDLSAPLTSTVGGQNASSIVASAQAVSVRHQTTTLMYATNQVVENRIESSSHLGQLANVVASAGSPGHGDPYSRNVSLPQVPMQQHRSLQTLGPHLQLPSSRTIHQSSAPTARDELRRHSLMLQQESQRQLQQESQRQLQQNSLQLQQLPLRQQHYPMASQQHTQRSSHLQQQQQQQQQVQQQRQYQQELHMRHQQHLQLQQQQRQLQLQHQQQTLLEVGSNQQQLPAPVAVRRLHPGPHLSEGPFETIHAASRLPHAPVPTYPTVSGQNSVPTQLQQTQDSLPINPASKVVSHTANDADSVELRCHYCQQHASFMCSECKQAWYCKLACQVEDWPRHSQTCRLVKGSNTRQ